MAVPREAASIPRGLRVAAAVGALVAVIGTVVWGVEAFLLSLFGLSLLSIYEERLRAVALLPARVPDPLERELSSGPTPRFGAPVRRPARLSERLLEKPPERAGGSPTGALPHTEPAIDAALGPARETGDEERKHEQQHTDADDHSNGHRELPPGSNVVLFTRFDR
jgi:hypothetical protein